MKKETITCNSCANEISQVHVHYFDFNGGDSYEKIDIVMSENENECNYIQVCENATLNNFLDDYDDFIEHVSCPFCDEFPFEKIGIQVVEVKHVVFEYSNKREIEY